jgi:peptide/nickel transport system permease protein
MIPTIIGITILVFIIINAAPGNPLSHMADPSMRPEDIQSALEKMGMFDPLYVRYFNWFRELLSGNLGYSFRYKSPVIEMIKSRAPATLSLGFMSIFISFIIAVPIGVYSATRQYSTLDYIFTVFAMAGLSIPVFFFGIVLIKWFAFDLRWLPIGGMVTMGRYHANALEYWLDVGRHMILPLTVLSYANMARFMRFTRSSMLEVIRQDYIRTARAKGLNERVVIYKHALRNAMIPVITILGLSLPALFSGALLTETVFVWPGMGSLNVEAVSTRDYPLLMGINLVLALFVLAGNLLADIMYAVVDPRIKYD